MMQKNKLGQIAESVSGEISQRLSMKQLKAWQELRYGMFICFGMNTYNSCYDQQVNLLLSVPPNKDGIIPDKWIRPLMELKQKIDNRNK